MEISPENAASGGDAATFPIFYDSNCTMHLIGLIMKKQAHIFYSGRVQGVGFRVTVEETANQYRVAGWVKNLPDKRVEVIVEGEEKKVIMFLNDLRVGSMKNFIHNVDTIWNSASESFSDFQIRYY